METPICVADAKTFIDHIQDIKRWIYKGQLRLVVPSSTFEHVEQLHQKSKEIKPTPKDASRPKSSGKPAKKEHPAFDLNPLIAQNFLARLKSLKEEDPTSERRIFFQETENSESLTFQQPNEQYTPWKDLEIEEEKPQVAEERPSTWAEALRRKQNLANGGGGNSLAPKGPARPKLVAKAAGSDASPWKIKKDAPKISAKDVPSDLRPLMSCILWRLHESIDRNDANELFLLSDQDGIRTVAEKLNINVQSTNDLSVLVASKAKRPDPDVFGDLEREFGVQRKEPAASVPSSSSQEGGPNAVKNGGEDVMKQEEKMTRSISSEGSAKTDESHSIELDDHAGTETPAENISGKSGENGSEKTLAEDVLAESSMTLMEDHESEKKGPYENEAHSKDLPVGGIASIVIDDSRIGSSSISEHASQEFLAANTDVPPAVVSSATEAAKPSQSMSDQKSMSPTMPPAGSLALKTPPSSSKAVQELDDSDEEVVVFVPQPKRFSAQKKPAQQNSRPSTPISQPQNKLQDQSPNQLSATAQAQPKPQSRGRNSMVMSNSHPQATGSPTVIDPDAFGRSFAVNTNPSPRGLHNPRSHHRPRSSLENAQFPQRPRSSRQHDTRISPQRLPVDTRSPRLSPAPELNYSDNTTSQNHQMQRTSPQRRSKAVEPGAVAPRGRGPNHANPGLQSQPKSLNDRMVESEEFIPRTAFTGAQFGPIGTPPKAAEKSDTILRKPFSVPQAKPKAPESRLNEPDDFVPRSSMPVAQLKQRIPEPRMFEPNEFVPRSAISPSQIKQRIAEPDSIEPRASMPDVQYVLKSGSTRAATRGRGRLWIPS